MPKCLPCRSLAFDGRQLKCLVELVDCGRLSAYLAGATEGIGQRPALSAACGVPRGRGGTHRVAHRQFQ